MLLDAQDWFDVKGAVKAWQDDGNTPTPFKLDWRSPIRDLRTGDIPNFVRIDPAHTYAIEGIGKSFLASAILVLCHVGWFGNGPIDMKFKNAYARFIAFCEAHGKSTTITEFSYKTLKLPQNSFLSRKL